MSSAGGIGKDTYVAASQSGTAEGGRADRISRVEGTKAVLVLFYYTQPTFVLIVFLELS